MNTLRRNLVHTTLPFTSKVGIYAVPCVFFHKHYLARQKPVSLNVFLNTSTLYLVIQQRPFHHPSPISPLPLSLLSPPPLLVSLFLFLFLRNLSFCTILISSHFCHVPIFLPFSFLVSHFPLSLSFLKT